MSHSPRIDAAERYIAAEKSDPFVRNRVYSHMAKFNAPGGYLKHNYAPQGVCGFRDKGEDAFYSADEVTEERSYIFNGIKHIYHATIYRNVKRP